jgi:predicted acetyltransferase
MHPSIRPVTPGEYQEVLNLWERAFKPSQDYFVRYFDGSDPWYQEGDCLGYWLDGRLVSAVHVCRRPLEWPGETLWCAALANVATHPDFRRRGLSRELLEVAAGRLQGEGFAFSMLFSSQPGHYQPLGWESVAIPHPVLHISEELEPAGFLYEPFVSELDESLLYAEAPARPLQLYRPEAYWSGWAAWLHQHREVQRLTVNGRAYAELECPEDLDRPARLLEWRAADARAEGAILRKAALWAKARGKGELTLEAVPQWGGLAALAPLGEAEPRLGGYMMLRNVNLAESRFRDVAELYRSGAATWWPADGF